MTSSTNIRQVYLTGAPGVGKTTLIRQVLEHFRQDTALSIKGFYTTEVRSRGQRTGFDVVTMTGQNGPLARIGSGKGPMVGRYIVDVPSFETIVIPELTLKDPLKSPTLVVLDELGKMEHFSSSFVQLASSLIGQSEYPLLGTIPVGGSSGKRLQLVEEIRSRKDVKVFMVTKENRNTLLPEIIQAVTAAGNLPT